jgi:hypothetical protein
MTATPVTLYVTETQRQLAKKLAEDRIKSHDETRKPEDDLGDPVKAAYLEYFACLAEIVLLESIERDCINKGANFRARFKLWLTERCPDPDIILPTMRIDIKSLPPKWNYLNIKKTQADDGPDAADYFVVVKFESDRKAIILNPIKRAIVKTWKEGDVHSPFYGVDLREFPIPPFTGDLWRLVNPSSLSKPTLSPTMLPTAGTHTASSAPN